VPNGYLKVNAPNLTDPQAKKLQGEWMRAHGGLMRRVAVLNATTEFHAINLDPQALQLAQMRDYSVVDWCLIFGVNPYMLGTTQDRSTYANVESRMTEFAEFTLLPWARRVESACDAELPRGSNMRINLDSLKRADTLARYQAHKIGLDAEFLTVDEVRDMEDRPAMPVEQADEAVAAAAEAARLRLVGGAPT
jgi:HK97 family phage portal protein